MEKDNWKMLLNLHNPVKLTEIWSIPALILNSLTLKNKRKMVGVVASEYVYQYEYKCPGFESQITKY